MVQKAIHLNAEDWAIDFNAEDSMISPIVPGTSTDGEYTTKRRKRRVFFFLAIF